MTKFWRGHDKEATIVDAELGGDGDGAAISIVVGGGNDIILFSNNTDG